jgi:hypothetical protein
MEILTAVKESGVAKFARAVWERVTLPVDETVVAGRFVEVPANERLVEAERRHKEALEAISKNVASGNASTSVRKLMATREI